MGIQFMDLEALCFEDISQIVLSHDWWKRKFNTMMVSIDMCNPKTYSGTCKTEQEIHDYFETNVFGLEI